MRKDDTDGRRFVCTGDGWLHRADPRVKFLITVVMLVLCLVWRNWAFILDVLIIEHLMLITDGVPLKLHGWVWKILAVIIVFIVVLWPIFDPSGTHVLWQWGWLKLTRENLVMAAVMGCAFRRSDSRASSRCSPPARPS